MRSTPAASDLRQELSEIASKLVPIGEHARESAAIHLACATHFVASQFGPLARLTADDKTRIATHLRRRADASTDPGGGYGFRLLAVFMEAHALAGRAAAELCEEMKPLLQVAVFGPGSSTEPASLH